MRFVKPLTIDVVPPCTQRAQDEEDPEYTVVVYGSANGYRTNEAKLESPSRPWNMMDDIEKPLVLFDGNSDDGDIQRPTFSISLIELSCDPCSEVDQRISVLVLLFNFRVDEHRGEIETALNLVDAGIRRVHDIRAGLENLFLESEQTKAYGQVDLLVQRLEQFGIGCRNQSIWLNLASFP